MKRFGRITATGVLILATVLATLAPLAAPAQLFPKCEFCGRLLGSQVYRMKDKFRQISLLGCETCAKTSDRCEVCRLPNDPRNPLSLPDGRRYCARDWKTLVNEPREAEQLFGEVIRDVARHFVPWGAVPDQNITFQLVNREEFIRESRRSVALHDPEEIMGLTRSHISKHGKPEHSIFVLNGLSRAHFMAVCAHEFTHAWLAEHASNVRQLHRDTIEGFCELMAWKLMEQHRESGETERLADNTYTHGQLQTLRAADEAHRFYRVVDWMLNGVDAWLEPGKLDRVFVLRDDAKPSANPVKAVGNPAPSENAANPARPAPPDRLILRGVLGTERSGRTALINGAMLRANEAGRVRLGASNVVVHCLEVRADAAIVLIEPGKERQELKLTAK